MSKKYLLFLLIVFLCAFSWQKAKAQSNVTIISPSENAAFAQGNTVTVSGTYTYGGSGVCTLTLWVGNQQIDYQQGMVGSNLPFSLSWNTTGYSPGSYTLTVELQSANNSNNASASVSVTVIEAQIWPKNTVTYFPKWAAGDTSECEIDTTTAGDPSDIGGVLTITVTPQPDTGSGPITPSSAQAVHNPAVDYPYIDDIPSPPNFFSAFGSMDGLNATIDIYYTYKGATSIVNQIYLIGSNY